MNNQPITFIESRKQLLKQHWYIVVFILFFIGAATQTMYGEIASSKFLYFFVPAILIACAFYALYPRVTLEVSKSGFVYRKGNKRISADWTSVSKVAVQSGKRGDGGFDTLGGMYFFIDMGDVVLDFIPVKSLVYAENMMPVDGKKFLSIIQLYSGKKIAIGTKLLTKYNYSSINFEDYPGNSLQDHDSQKSN